MIESYDTLLRIRGVRSAAIVGRRAEIKVHPE